MKITLYVRDVDTEVWAWAKERGREDRDSLSRVVVDALRHMRNQEIRADQQTVGHQAKEDA